MGQTMLLKILIAKHFKAASEIDFLGISFGILLNVLQHDELKTDSEELVVDVVLTWISYHPQSAQGPSVNCKHAYEQ